MRHVQLLPLPSNRNESDFHAQQDTDDSDIVTGHMNSQPTDTADGAHDGIYLGHQHIAAATCQRHVLAQHCSEGDIRTVCLREGEDLFLKDVP